MRKADAHFWDIPVTRVERDGSPSKLTDENVNSAPPAWTTSVYRTLNCPLEFRIAYV